MRYLLVLAALGFALSPLSAQTQPATAGSVRQVKAQKNKPKKNSRPKIRKQKRKPASHSRVN